MSDIPECTENLTAEFTGQMFFSSRIYSKMLVKAGTPASDSLRPEERIRYWP
jgi:hypothetical protein